jgi:hypothetical protein
MSVDTLVPTLVAFFDEGDRVGRVFLVDEVAFGEWCQAGGLDPRGWSVPFSESATGVEEIGRMPYAAAYDLAAEMKLELREW